MVPAGIDGGGQQEVEGPGRHAKWSPVNLVICLSSRLRFAGTGRRSERRRAFIGDLVRDRTCAPAFEVVVKPISAPPFTAGAGKTVQIPSLTGGRRGSWGRSGEVGCRNSGANGFY